MARSFFFFSFFFFFFQAEDGIRDAQESRGLGDVYKRQMYRAAKTIVLISGYQYPSFNDSEL